MTAGAGAAVRTVLDAAAGWSASRWRTSRARHAGPPVPAASCAS